MFNIRWGLVPAVFALLVSVLLGIISGAGFAHIILRALIFMITFFGLGMGLWFVVNSYFPEILVSDNDTALQYAFEQAGSRVNITLDSSGEYAVPELYRAAGAPGELGNIEDLISGTFKVRPESVDRTQEEEYNEVKDQGILEPGHVDFNDMFQEPVVFAKSVEKKPVFTPSFADDAGGLGSLPDLDAMATVFSSAGESSSFMSGGGSKSGSGGISADNGFGEAESLSGHFAGNKPQPLKGDFNPKELAEGIRTILSKDK